MDTTITSAAMATIIACLFSISLNLYLQRKNINFQERAFIDNLIIEIIRKGMEYPSFDNDKYCEAWPPENKNTDESIRYENYCCLVFNTIEKIWKHCKGNEDKINEILCVSELINSHQKWWKSEILSFSNINGYPPRFREYVNEVIEKQERKK